MAQYQINAVELTRQVFGIKGYLPSVNGVIDENFEYDSSKIETFEVADQAGTSIFGTPIYETLTLIKGDFEYKFLDAPLMDINRSKHIVTSKVQGLNGNVHEIIGDNDFQVRIRGVLVNDTQDDLPYDKMEQMVRLCDYNEALKVESRILNLHGIYNLILRKPFFPASDKFVNVQPYVIDCISDRDIQLIIDL